MQSKFKRGDKVKVNIAARRTTTGPCGISGCAVYIDSLTMSLEGRSVNIIEVSQGLTVTYYRTNTPSASPWLCEHIVLPATPAISWEVK